MKIKKTRQVRLDELIKYVWDNGITSTIFQSCRGQKINIGITGTISHDPVYYFNKEDLFLIEEEVEITEESTLNVTVVFSEHIGNKNYSTSIYDVSINELKGNEKIKFIYLQNDDGSIGDLIWTKERGLID